MKRYQFNDETKHLFNKTKKIQNFIIARVGWLDKSWLIVTDMDFNKICHRPYHPEYIAPIAQFELRDELWAYLKDKLV